MLTSYSKLSEFLEKDKRTAPPPRKIVVSLTTRYDKSKVLEKASSLRERGNKWKNVYINSDKTQKEQEQDYRDTPGEKGVGERGRQREGLQIAPRKKKKTGKLRKGLDHIQGRNYHQTNPTTRNRG